MKNDAAEASIHLVSARERISSEVGVRGGSVLLRGAFGETLVAPPGTNPRTKSLVELQALLPLVAAGAVVVDVGACFGLFTCAFARAVGTSGVVGAIEPSHASYRALEENVSNLGLQQNTRLLRGAISPQNGFGTIWVNRGCQQHNSTVKANVPDIDHGEPVRMWDLKHSVLRELGLPRVDLLKVDIEGAEASLLADGGTFLSSTTSAVWMEFWPGGLERAGTSPRAFLDEFTALGFEVDMIDIIHTRWHRLQSVTQIMEYCASLEEGQARGTQLGEALVYLLLRNRFAGH